MQDVISKLDDNGHGDFFIMNGKEQVARMEISVSGNTMTVHHTCVAQDGQGKGFAKKLLAAMIDYVRDNGLEVIPVCYFVRRQFIRHSERYPDVWYREKPSNQIKDESEPWIFT